MITTPPTIELPSLTHMELPTSAQHHMSGGVTRAQQAPVEPVDRRQLIDATVLSKPSNLLTECLGTTVLSSQSPTDDLLEEYGLLSSACDAIYKKLRRISLAELLPIMQSLLNQPVPSVRARGKTIDRKTIAKEDKEVVRLMRRFANEHRLSMQTAEFPYVRFANWLLVFSFRVKPRTFKQYRNHVIDYLDSIPGEDVLEAIDILCHSGSSTSNGKDRSSDDNADDNNEDVPNVSHDRRPQIVKKFPVDDFDTLIWYLRFKSRSPQAGNLAFLLEASIITGLRPSEWKQATILSDIDPTAPFGRRVFLFVANAKANNGRGNGVVRTLDLSDFTDEDNKAVNHTIDLAKQLNIIGQFDSKFLKRFIDMISRLTTLLWGSNAEKAYSLYSCRHQASANWKTGMAVVSVAALSGHAVPRTAIKWYGKKQDAWPKQRIQNMAKPSFIEVMQIVDRMMAVHKYDDDMKGNLVQRDKITLIKSNASPNQSP